MIIKIKPLNLFLLVFCMTLFLLLSGCANYTYYKPGITDEQARRDNLECQQFVMQSIMAKGYQGNSVGMALEEDRAKHQCLIMLGYEARRMK